MGPMVGMAVTVAEASDSFGSDPFPGRLGFFAGSRILTAKGKRHPNPRAAKHAKKHWRGFAFFVAIGHVSIPSKPKPCRSGPCPRITSYTERFIVDPIGNRAIMPYSVSTTNRGFNS
jgi:hypothetical protein